MDFQLSPSQREFQETARRFAREQLIDVAEEIETDGAPISRDWLKRFADMGFLGINISDQYGDLGLGNLEALLVLEEFAKVSSAVAFPIFESSVGPVRAVDHFGSDALKARIIPQVCAGDYIVAVAMSEPEAGTALTDLKTRAEVIGGEIVINGSKRWCSGGGHSDGYVVYCRLSDEPGAKGIGAVFVEKTTSGVSFGEPEALMGFRGIPSADIYFDNATVPAGGFAKLMAAFDLERCGNATMALAQASGALEDVLDYVQERKQFGKTDLLPPSGPAPMREFDAVLCPAEQAGA